MPRPAGRYDGTVKCDRCEHEATVHEVRIEAGKRREKHLCEQCAKADGVSTPQVPAPLTTLLSNFMLQQGDAVSPASQQPPTQSAAMTTPCVECGTTYAQFRQNGLLGCATCYTQFENQLVPLLARAHEGGTSHKGKAPRRLTGAPVAPTAVGKPKPVRVAAPAIDPQTVAKLLVERIAMLKKRLAEAIAEEEYETAAKLRDELARLEGMPQTGTLPSPAPPPPQGTPKRKPRSPGERSHNPPPDPDTTRGSGEGAS